MLGLSQLPEASRNPSRDNESLRYFFCGHSALSRTMSVCQLAEVSLKTGTLLHYISLNLVL